MTHLKVMNLLTALSNAKKIMNDINQYDDHDLIQLLETKYEQIYKELSKS